MKRRGLTLSLTFLIFSLSLAGCSSTRKPDRLVLWHTLEAPVARMALERKILDYNKRHPEVEVVPILAGKSDTSLTAIQRAGTTKDRPDLIWAYPALAAQLADSGVAVPLDDYLDDFDRSSVYPVLWQQTTYRGKIWGLPFDHDNLAIFYNRNHFREANQAIPRTWSEFRSAARALTRDGRHGFLIPFGKEEWAVWTWETLLWQAGGDLLDSHDRPVFDSPAGVKALAFWRGLLADGSAILSLPEKGAKPDDFIQGKVSMFMSGPWTLSELPRNFPYGVFPLPRDRRAVTNIGGEALFLVKRDERSQRKAWNFAKHLVSTEFQTAWATEAGYLPVNRKVPETPAYQNLLKRQPATRVFLDAMETGRVRPCHPAYPMISDALGTGLMQGLSGKKDPQTALREARKNAESRIKWIAGKSDKSGDSAPGNGRPAPAPATPR